MASIASFRDLHNNTLPLRLPNAWDAGSARLFATQGAPAIATTSAGIAWALGYRDGGNIPIDEFVAGTARIARVLTVPLSIDIENGYSDQPTRVAEHVMRLVNLGVAGINIEDGADGADLLTAKIDAIRNAVSKAGSDLFVNARCDVFLSGLVESEHLTQESISRGRQYARAGADGLFLPGMVQPQQIAAVVEQISLPLNIMAWPGLADAAELGKMGVRRLSAGSAISQVVWGTAARLARDFLTSGRSDPLSEASMPYAELQNLFSKK